MTMGVNVSLSRKQAQVKYIQCSDCDETFLKDNWTQETETMRYTDCVESFPTRNDSRTSQIKSSGDRGKANFDSLDAVDSRKSAPFAVPPAAGSGEAHKVTYHTSYENFKSN